MKTLTKGDFYETNDCDLKSFNEFVDSHGNEIPAVSEVKLKASLASTTLTFAALSIGSCDVFSGKFETQNGVSVLTISKSSIEHCTRPEHALAYERKQLVFKYDVFPGGTIVLANPLLVTSDPVE